MSRKPPAWTVYINDPEQQRQIELAAAALTTETGVYIDRQDLARNLITKGVKEILARNASKKPARPKRR